MYQRIAYTYYYTIYITIILYYTMVTIEGGKRDERLATQKEEPKTVSIAKIEPPKAIICRCGCDSCDGTEDCECVDCCDNCACEA